MGWSATAGLPRPIKQLTDSTLPADVAMARGRRLKFVAALVGATSCIYTLLYLTVWVAHSNPVGRASGIAIAVVSLMVAALANSRARSRRSLAVIGIGYEIFVGFAVAIGEYCSTAPPSIPSGQISWICVVIILFPFIVPSTPRVLLVAALVTAFASPIAYVVGVAAGLVTEVGTTVLVSLFLPQFLCAVISYFPAKLLNRLGSEARRAIQLGSYELLEKLGEGGMGEVWRARHQLLSRPAAVKTVRIEKLGSGNREELEMRFMREAQATALLESPHTVELYDFGVSEDGVFYYVMELLEGIDLERLVREDGPQPATRVVHFLRQACDSLAEAHHAGLVHRDIKPGDLFAAKRALRFDVLKVLDFGLVKESAESGETNGESTLSVVRGTPAYLAPESIVEGSVDGRADIYALGCVGYWLLTGSLVFPEATAMKMAVAHATATPRPPSAHLETPLHRALEDLVLWCLSKEPADRPQTATALGEALADLELARWTDEDAADWWGRNLGTVADAPALSSSPTLLVPRLVENATARLPVEE